MKNKIINTLFIMIIVAVFGIGVILVVRENFLLPDADFVMPATPSPILKTGAPLLTPLPSIQIIQETSLPTPDPTPYVKPIPVKISFIGQKQSCEIFPGGILEDGLMEVIDRHDASSWLTFSASPGDTGNSIIAGHKSKNHIAGTFMALWDIKIDDLVLIDFEDGQQRWFSVYTINRYPFDEIPSSVMDFDGETRLTLITCIGEWDNGANTSSERLIVVCKPLTEPED